MLKNLFTLTLAVSLLTVSTSAIASSMELVEPKASYETATTGPLGMPAPESNFCLIEENYPLSDVTYATSTAIFNNFSAFRQNPFAVMAVRRNLELFSEAIKKRFGLYLQRSGKYISVMTDILKKEGIPEDIVFLSMIESGFSTRALSPKKAAGPWQFIPETGKRYGLRIDSWVDERRDPVKSTHAAAKYLRALHKRFNSWELAMAAYNAGEMKVQRAINSLNTTDFWEISLTRHIKTETKEYVPRFIAAKLIADDPEGFGFPRIEYDENLQYDEVLIPYQLSLADIAQAAGVDRDLVKELNPELKKQRTPPVEQYALKLPVGTKETFLANMPTKPSAPGKDEINMRSASRKKPVSKRTTAASAKQPAAVQNTVSEASAEAKPAIAVAAPAVSKRYVVRKGDNLWSIARKSGVSTQAILDANNLGRASRLKPGQRIAIPADS